MSTVNAGLLDFHKKEVTYEYLRKNIKPLGNGKFLTSSFLVGNSLFGRVDWIQRIRPEHAIVTQTFEGALNSEGQPHGAGILKKRDGSIIEGCWESGVFLEPKPTTIPLSHALPVQTCHQATVKCNQVETGSFTYPDKSEYIGEMAKKKPNGYGRRIYPNGMCYEGTFLKGHAYGQGKCTYPNGDIYEGNWVNGEKSGHGVYRSPTNDRYEGNWANNKRNGHGLMTFSTGVKYDGNFEDNKFTGHGVMTYPNGDKYEGNWENDMQSGQGVMTYVNGNKYDGNWQNARQNGQGIMYYSDGTEDEGLWIGGKIVLRRPSK